LRGCGHAAHTGVTASAWSAHVCTGHSTSVATSTHAGVSGGRLPHVLSGGHCLVVFVVVVMTEEAHTPSF
jgi:hypothetical protein